MHTRHLRTLVATTAAITPLAALPAATLAATPSKTYRGPGVTMRWGTVQVTLTVSGTKVLHVTATYPTERVRSMLINQQAVPVLDSEALKAQSASINHVSGATLTSRAFVTSLEASLHAAHL
jgi:uncharacterized protein with FMN-binding domain